MSFLSEAISTEYEEVSQKVPELQLEVDNFKTEVLTFFRATYIEHLMSPRNKEVFDQKVLQFEKELKDLSRKLGNVNKKSTSEMHKCLIALRSSYDRILLISNLCYIHKQLIVFDSIHKNKKYKDAMSLISMLETAIVETCDEEFYEVIQAIGLLVISKKNDLIMKFQALFSENISIECSNTCTFLKIGKSQQDLNEISSSLLLEFVDLGILYNFSRSVMKSIFEPLANTSVEISTGKEENFNFIKMMKSEKPLVYSGMLNNILVIIKFLDEYLNVSRENEGSTIFKNLVEYIGPNLSKMISEHFEEHTVPAISKDLIKVEDVLREIDIFEKIIEPYKIFPDENTRLVNFSKNSYTDQICKQHAKTIQELIQKDLMETEKIELMFDKNKYCCEISQSTSQMVRYLKTILLEAKADSKTQIVRVVKNAISSYILLVPEYHKTVLDVFPRAVAIFHNNCFYISEILTGWIDKDAAQLTEEIHRLELTGAKHFSNNVENQIMKVEVALASNEITNNKEKVSNSSLAVTTQIFVEKCFKLFEDLTYTWENVLPSILHHKAIGEIMNTFCDHFINRICEFEQYSPEMIEHLKHIINMVFSSGRELFTGTEIEIFVPSWKQIQEIMFLLSSTLAEVERKWCNGIGILGVLFDKPLMKKLVTIFFPNDENREILLMKFFD